jgi:predicted AlkP superfamily pyrophosphatase or phosphodiesterase
MKQKLRNNTKTHMKPYFPLRLICLVLLAALSLSMPRTAAAAPALTPQTERYVVLISVDGLASYYLEDAGAMMPTMRRLALEGVSADRMKCSFPTVTWPNHTTLVTGVHPAKHGVIGNNYWNRTTNGMVPLIPDPLFDKDEIVKVPTIYDVAHDAGLKTAGVVWPATRNASKLDWTMPDIFSDVLFQKYSTRSLLTELKVAGIPYEMQETWCRTNKGEDRDIMYASTAAHILRRHKPNLLLLHLVELDHVEHAKGPQSPEAYNAVRFADKRVQQVMDAIEAAGLKDKATVIVTSDHGFAPYRQQIQPNVKLKQEGLLKLDGTKITSRQATALAQGGSCFIYVLDNANHDRIARRLAGVFKKVEGVESVIEAKDFAKHGLANPERNPQMADLVLSAKEGYSFSDNANGDVVVTPPSDNVKGTHGHDPANPKLYGTFIAWGSGIKAGARLKEMNNIDVAPTIARLMGVRMKDTDGKVLEQILEK